MDVAGKKRKEKEVSLISDAGEEKIKGCCDVPRTKRGEDILELIEYYTLLPRQLSLLGRRWKREHVKKEYKEWSASQFA